MSTTTLDIDRFMAFVYETETAITLLDEGIERLAAWDGGEDRRFVAMQLLAQGFERFLKVTRAVIQLNTEGTLPTSRQFRTEYGHGLSKLLDDIVAACRQDSDFTDRPAIGDDLDFLATDGHWREMVEILSDFGSGGRYHDLNAMLDGPSGAPSPLERLEELEMDFCRADASWLRLMESNAVAFQRKWYPALAAKQTETLQRAARAVARMWTLGPASENGRRLTGIINRFLFLTDDKLSTPYNRHPAQ